LATELVALANACAKAGEAEVRMTAKAMRMRIWRAFNLTAPGMSRCARIDYLFTHFCKHPPDALVSHPLVSPAKMLPSSSAAIPSGSVPGMK
jgi:hypothetical protein